MRRIAPLIGILLAAWVMVYVGSIVIFVYIVNLPPVTAGREGYIITNILKTVFSAALAAVWLLIIYWLTKSYLRHRLSKESVG